MGGVRYSEVNLEGFHRIGSQIVCPLLGDVRYSACPLFKCFTVSKTMLKLYLRDRTFSPSGDVIARHRQELNVKKANKGIRKSFKTYTDKSKCDA